MRSAARSLRRNPHDICLVTDGDADRIGAMDGRGTPMTNQQVIALLLHHLVRNRGGRGVVTKTFNTTAMVDKMCAAWNLPLTEVGIGFRFIAPELMKPGALFGAEESGSVGFANHIPERDGLAAGLVPARNAGDGEDFREQNLRAAGKGIWPAPLRPV